MSEINTSNFKKEHGDLAPDLVGVTELTSPYFFVPPSGSTLERPENCEPGTLRFNTDIGSLEIFRGKTIGWESIKRRDSQYLGGGTGSNTGTGTRAIYAGGSDAGSSAQNPIDFITISTLGDAQDFGDMGTATNRPGGLANNVRGLISGGSSPSYTDTIEFITVAQLGNATDFGNLTASKWYVACVSNQTRGIMGGGYGPANTNVIEFVAISQTGNGVDFGDLSGAKREVTAVCSTTRGIYTGGQPGSGATNVMEFITMSTTGDGTDFGDLSLKRLTMGAGTSATRGVIFGGGSPGASNVIDFVTMATTGNAIDFGDTLEAKSLRQNGITSDCVRALTAGYSGGNVIEFVTIATTGNSKDFGDLTDDRFTAAALSNGHGGL